MKETKQKLIEAIRQRNQSTSPEYLRRFNEQALQSYLNRLTSLVSQRGPESVWVRPRGPAVTASHPEPIALKPRRAAASF